MKPLLSTKTFSSNQVVSWTVTAYDTPHTIASKGMYYRPSTPTSAFGSSIDFSSATLSAMNTHFDNNTTPGLVDDDGNEVQGRIPNIYSYWGTQAPIGVSAAGTVALRFKGYVKTTGTYGFAAVGQGNIKIFHESSSILVGAFDENFPQYTTSLVSMTAGDQIDIFYWGLNPSWGGLGIRVFSDADVATAADGIDWELLRETDILSASWMDSEETVNSFTLSEELEVSFTETEGQVTACDIPIVLGGAADIDGWQFDHVNKTLSIIGGSDTLKKGTLIKVTGGYVSEQHPQFTGEIIDLVPGETKVTLKCTALEGRMTTQLSENLPDRLSYAAFGYTARIGISEPVFGVPAYDNWPYEHAIKDLVMRSWADASLLNGKKQMLRVDEVSLEDGEDLFRAKDFSGNHIKIQRQANYGNPYGNANLPADDDYLTASELTATLYARTTELVDRIGYLFKTDSDGNFMLLPVNSPSSLTHISSPPGGTTVVYPACIGGTYEKFTGTGWSYVASGIKASRLELVTLRSSGYGSLNVQLDRAEDSWSDSTTIDLDNDDTVAYYDKVLTVDLTNITSFAVLEGAEYGTYTITVTPSGGGGGTEYGLNALRIYEVDPQTPITEFNLSSLKNAITLAGKSNFTSMVNDAIVTGARRATITDSEKVYEDIVSEFIVSRSTDTHSILNPLATNYLGRKLTAFLSDEAISEQDLADWASRTLVSRYRVPEPSVSATHTAIPSLELYDPVYVTDNQFSQYDPTKVYWVTSFKTTYKPAEALVEIELTPFPISPSFEPREEIDLSLFYDKPAINLSISYPSLSGSGTITNPTTGIAQPSTLIVSSGTVATDGGGDYMTVSAGTVSPGTDLLHVPTLGGTTYWSQKEELKYFKNNPYHKFYTKSGTRLNLPFDCGDGSAEYGLNGWFVEVGDSAEFSFHKIQDLYSGTSPFYDPYYSELPVPELIEVSFDALVSGFYRVSVVSARGNDPTVVAWLTNPGGTEPDEEVHWAYLTAGSNKTFSWDGVDTVGEWNLQQSEEYTWRQRGNFPNFENPAVGANVYAANDLTTAMTHISSEIESTEAAYPIGKYSQFYVKIELMRDITEEILVVQSSVGGDDGGTNAGDLFDSDAAALDSRFIYYHLPQPNKVSITISDWDINEGDYDPVNPGNDWLSVPDNDATIRDTKPVKISITPIKRVGAKFTSSDYTNVRINRVAHLSAQIWDQTAIISTESWNSKSAGINKKRINTRRLSNDEHTLVFEDEFFTPGDQITDWTFYPTLFEKDFGQGVETLGYTDYLQILEVPSWNPGRTLGEDYSRHLMAMMGYLFYLSVYTQDRSGRLVWAVDTSFVDKSKILDNTDTTTFPNDLDRHQRRTVFTRQWWDYEYLDEALGDDLSVPNIHYGGYTDRFDYHSRDDTDELYPLADTTSYKLGVVETAYLDPYSEVAYNEGRLKLDGISGTDPFKRDLGDTSNTTLGDWTWETDGFSWIPDISRDFHPFYVVPPMPLASYRDGNGKTWWEGNFWYAIGEDPLGSENADEAKFDNYFSVIRDRTAATFNDKWVLKGGKVVESEFTDSNGNPKAVPNDIIQFQKQDDMKHYEDCRGAWTNGPKGARDPISVGGGDPYYLNTKLYRHFRKRNSPLDSLRIRHYNDVWRKGWFFVTFRHTYNWESASMFPVDASRAIDSGAMDVDKTGSPLPLTSYDPGGYAGWKDDHPSNMQSGTWAETGSADELHWRNDNTNLARIFTVYSGMAGGDNTIEDPSVALDNEDKPTYAAVDQNIFWQRTVDSAIFTQGVDYDIGMMPIAVGPRLPQTRRLLMALTLVNTRRTTPVS